MLEYRICTRRKKVKVRQHQQKQSPSPVLAIILPIIIMPVVNCRCQVEMKAISRERGKEGENVLYVKSEHQKKLLTELEE